MQVHDEELTERIVRLRRVRMWWNICLVPLLYFLYVGVHDLAGGLIPYWLLQLVWPLWLTIGYLVSGYIYYRMVAPVWGPPKFGDVLSLHFPKQR